jgi:hypothetical protein
VSEPARVAADIQHLPPLAQLGDRPPVVALVEVEAGFLAVADVDAVLHAMFDHGQIARWLAAGDSPVAGREALLVHDAGVGASPDANGLQELMKFGGDESLALRQREARPLHQQIVAIPIDGQPAQAVPLAENESAGPQLGSVTEEPHPAGDGSRDAAREELIGERLCLLPGVEPHADRTLWIEQAPSDELAGHGYHAHRSPRRGHPLDATDRPHEDPRVTVDRRSRLARPKPDGGGDHGRILTIN